MSSIETNKQTKNKLCPKQKLLGTAPAQCSEKTYMNLYAVSAKTLKTLKCLTKIFFMMDVRDLGLLLCLSYFLSRVHFLFPEFLLEQLHSFGFFNIPLF